MPFDQLLPTTVIGSHALPGWFWTSIQALEREEYGPSDERELYDDAVRLALTCCTKYRLPEPTRLLSSRVSRQSWTALSARVLASAWTRPTWQRSRNFRRRSKPLRPSWGLRTIPPALLSPSPRSTREATSGASYSGRITPQGIRAINSPVFLCPP